MDPVSNVPNGGWGWVVVAAVAFINMTNQSILSVFGLLFGSQLRHMQEETFTVALITNLNCVALNFSGLFIGPAIKNFKSRNVASTGCLMVSFGLFLCSFATCSWHFIVGYSFFVGIGLGLIAPSTFMAINSYFTTKRGRAVGLSLAGAGLGQVFTPHVVRYFLDNYGFRTAVLAMSVLSLTGLIGALFLKPLAAPLKYNNRKNIQLLLETDDKPLKYTNDPQIKIVTQSVNFKLDVSKTDSRSKKLCSKIGHRLAQAMDLVLLKDPVFWSIIIGMAMVYTSTVNFTMLFPDFLQQSVGFSRHFTATCMSVIAGADIVSRLVLPCITDKLKVPYRVVFLIGTIGLLIARSALAECVDPVSIIVMSIFTGMTKSATVLNNNLTISGHVGPDKLAGGLGLNMIAKGLLVITVGQFLGWIQDYTQSYVLGLHAQNIVLLLVTLVWAPEMCFRYKKQQKAKCSTRGDGTDVKETSNELLKIIVR